MTNAQQTVLTDVIAQVDLALAALGAGLETFKSSGDFVTLAKAAKAAEHGAAFALSLSKARDAEIKTASTILKRRAYASEKMAIAV